MARRAIVGTGIGNALEWYDWNVYATFSTFIAAQLFSKADPTSALLSTLAIFAVGFIARPFGGYLFGWLADRIGRKHSLMVAVICASVGSLLIAICPTYDQVGVWASAILLLARLVQGLAHGGELPSAQTYIAEAAPPARRGLWASSIYASGTVGLLFGMFLGLGLNIVLSDEAMSAWGWRIPFLLGAIFGLFAMWIRTRMEESEVFENEKETEGLPTRSILAGVWHHRRQALQVIGMTAGLTVTYYVWSVAMTPYAVKTLGFSTQQAFWASIIGNTALIASLPFWGMLSDRIGRKPLLLFAMIGSAVMYIPMLNLVQDQTWQLALAISVMCVILSADLAIAPAVYAEMFPTASRASAFGIPYAVCIALFGGTAPYVQAWMGTAFGPRAFPMYAIALGVVSALTMLTLPETKGRDLSD
ncbi:MFS transporter [Mobilicoccus pelagius]|uniref:Putative proline/betaine transporter n=1 Tax=Mobilicoccus pelagius NBRC 104925 TaxID=1089455 RepID=H5US66_9MICO|nr:putative major facilitator superfamily transporter [Mobilicoccus pelagius NBRC 104925]